MAQIMNASLNSSYAKGGARRLQESLLRPVDGAWLAAFRVFFGAVMTVSMARFLAYGWVERFFVEPVMHFKYYGFDWVEPLGAAQMTALFWALLTAAFCMAVGAAYRLSAFVFALGLSYVQLIDVATYLNHYYLAALLAWMLVAAPAHRLWSVDAWLKMRLRAWRDETETGTANANALGPSVAPRGVVRRAWLYLFRVQVGVVYFFAGLAKLNSDWLIHAQPLRIWLGARTDLPLLGPLFTIEGVPLLMSWAGFLFDTTIVLWLSWSRTRPWAYLGVLGFHAMTGLLFPIGMFPIIMSLAALVFFPPSWPRRLLRHLHGRQDRGQESRAQPSPSPQTPLTAAAPSRASRLLLSAMALYCLVQVAVPLRFLAYGGNVLWHEQGMRFSWRVMLRAKGGQARFVVYDPDSGQRWFVDPARYLTDLQVTEMVSQPDLILQMAHHLARVYRVRGMPQVQVRAESRISLNGRRSAVFVDPTVDLARVRDGLGVAPFLAQAPSTAPHHTRPVL